MHRAAQEESAFVEEYETTKNVPAPQYWIIIKYHLSRKKVVPVPVTRGTDLSRPERTT